MTSKKKKSKKMNIVISSPAYEGGQIIAQEGSFVPEHYHVSYFVGVDKNGYGDKYEGGYIVDVMPKGFYVLLGEEVSKEVTRATTAEEYNKIAERVLFQSASLEEAVKWCFERYAERWPGEKISPCWGAGAPNDTLKRLGYKEPEIDLPEGS